MSEIGYIKLYRSCKSNSFWQDKPFTRWQAFEDLILSAAFEQNRILLKGQVVMLERGQLIKGLDTFANDWGWSRKKVRTFLKLLENEKMAMSKGTPMGTLVTVVNYDFYQGEGPSKGMAKGPAEGNQRAIKGQPKGNKERNKESSER